MRRLLRLVLAVAVTAVCATLLAVELDGAALGAVLAAVEPAPAALAAGVAVTLPWWRGARLAALLPAARRPGGGALTRVAAEVLLWSFLLPFKLGELSFPWLLHRRAGLPLQEAAALFVLVRLADLLTVAGLLVLGAGAWPAMAERGLAGVAMLLGAALIAAPVGVIAVAGRWRDRRPAGRLARLVEGASHARTPAARLAVVGTTLGVWGSHVAIAALALDAVGVSVGLGATAAASAAGNLAFALPVSGVLGLGPQQVAFAAALEVAGVAWTPAVAVALGVHAVVAVTAVALGLAAWWTSPGRPRPAPRSPAGSPR
ncbi:MAG: hypothetical protein GVY33_03510 [Alphaproteobacteria bacterium]|jgi:hypothetical protein|nr:hypothetical protein [Alphaproteobacteria bacterium]